MASLVALVGGQSGEGDERWGEVVMGRVRQNEGGCVEQTWASLGIERGKTNLLRFLRMPSSTHTSSSKERMLCWCGETAGCLVEGAGEAGVKTRRGDIQ